jgi:hypothetical protein
MEPETPTSTGWLLASRAGRGPNEVDVGQLGEHTPVRVDMNNTPSG